MSDLIPYLLQAIGGLLALLIMILSWFGKRIQMQLDEIQAEIMHTERDMHEVVSRLDKRVTKIETHCALIHAAQKSSALSLPPLSQEGF